MIIILLYNNIIQTTLESIINYSVTTTSCLFAFFSVCCTPIENKRESSSFTCIRLHDMLRLCFAIEQTEAAHQPRSRRFRTMKGTSRSREFT